MSEPSGAAKEIASYVTFNMRGTTAGVHLRSYGGEALIAQAIQTMADEGFIRALVVTGDHEEDGKTVLDWERLGEL